MAMPKVKSKAKGEMGIVIHYSLLRIHSFLNSQCAMSNYWGILMVIAKESWFLNLKAVNSE